jgi:predicted amidohydrolase
MSTTSIPPAPAFKPFDLALIQLGQIGADKAANLKHAREMIRRAASGEGVGGARGKKPDLIVLPVSEQLNPCGTQRHHLSHACNDGCPATVVERFRG